MPLDLLDDQSAFGAPSLDQATVGKINLLKIEANEQIKHILHGRTAIMVIMGFTVLSTLIMLSLSRFQHIIPMVLIEDGVQLLIYGSCVYFFTTRPRICLWVAMLAFLLYYLLTVLVDGANLWRGLLVRIAIAYFLIRALAAVYTLDRHLEQLGVLGLGRAEVDRARHLGKLDPTANSSI